MRVKKMDEDTKYRVEDPDQDEDAQPGIMKPLPPAPEARRRGKKRPVPMVQFLGKTMKETSRDNLLFIVVPLLVGLMDANIYSWIVISVLEQSSIYLIVLPVLAAIPIGLLMPSAGRAIGGSLLTVIFFAIFIMAFLVAPGFYTQSGDISEFLMSAALLTTVYIFMVAFASLLGSIVGMLLREFF
ncbi:MAG: hypothetical protein KAT22_01775 [Candidatus Thorarchaeota archaeon]|nr:hypothetical protein [Candidatus Thorarchaeota archaeon]